MLFLKRKKENGFTLIELLVVIAIISLLSTVVMSSVSKARQKAQYAKARVEIKQFINAATLAQQEKGNLRSITGSGCSDCSCRGRDIRNIPASDSCYIGWINVITTIQNNTNGAVTNLTKMTRDSWGSPYGIDENDREGGPADCRFDTIRTAGPDGILYNGDDMGFTINLSRPCP
jgi:prepilin-type N-terminal cleavage/methylation domain-containing protein